MTISPSSRNVAAFDGAPHAYHRRKTPPVRHAYSPARPSRQHVAELAAVAAHNTAASHGRRLPPIADANLR